VSRLWAIAVNTFREAIRDRILYSILFFAGLVLVISLTMQELTVGDQDKVVRSIALGAIRGFGSIIAIFLGIGLVYKELERKTIYTIASKPIHRWLFILGKYAGLMGVIGAELLLMAGLYILLMTAQQGFPAASVFVSWVMLYFELGLLTAWAILFSSYSNPTTAASFSLAIFVIGHTADDIWLFGQQAENPAVRQIAELLYWLLPNFGVFNASDLAVHQLPIPWGQFVTAVLYGLGYTAVVLAGAIAVFSGRDFK
jgi:ABC-type transport system involved in multi-copper enzyme maturation permease subunit